MVDPANANNDIARGFLKYETDLIFVLRSANYSIVDIVGTYVVQDNIRYLAAGTPN